MKKTLTALVLAVLLITACSKDKDIPPVIEELLAAKGGIHTESRNGVFPISSTPFPVCTGDMVEYSGRMAYSYSISNNIISFHFNDSTINGLVDGSKAYRIVCYKDTSFTISAKSKYTIPTRVDWLFPSHITFNLWGILPITITTDSKMGIKLGADRMIMTCKNPPYLY